MAGKTWIQSTPPPAGVTYEWVGTPHASESIKRVDGVEVARNLAYNPRYALGTIGFMSGASRITAETGVLTIESTHSAPGSAYAELSSTYNPHLQPSAAAGRTFTFLTRLIGHDENPPPAISGIRVLSGVPGGSLGTTGEALATRAEDEVLRTTFTFPSGTDRLYPRIYNGAIQGVKARFGPLLVAKGLYEGDYFDGDTPDDRAGDTWLNPEEYKEYVWDSATKDWIPNPAAVSLSDNLFADPFFDYGLSSWSSWQQGGGTGVVRQGITSDASLPGHPNSFGMGAYSEGVGTSTASPIHEPRIYVKQGDHMRAVAWVMRSPGPVNPDSEVRIRPWRAPASGPTVSGTMASVRLADLPIGEWYELSGEWDLTEEGQYHAQPRVYMTSGSGGWPAGAAGLYLGYVGMFTGTAPPKGGVTEVSVATTTREALVGDVLARSRQKIDLKLALPDRRLRGGERIDLAAAAASASDVSWRWRQVTGPTVTLRRQGNTCSFIAPDVTETTPMRIAVSAATQEGGLRSNWEFFDLEITPTHGRFASAGPGVFSPYTPRMVGYSRGKRELWGDVLPPVGLDPQGRHDAEIVDIGFPADDVQVVADGVPPRRAPQGGVFIDLATGDVYQNFGEGYNEDEDTTGAPRRSAIMISPATGDVFQWIEGASDVG